MTTLASPISEVNFKLIDDTRVVIYGHNRFIIQAIGRKGLTRDKRPNLFKQLKSYKEKCFILLAPSSVILMYITVLGCSHIIKQGGGDHRPRI